MGLLFEWDPKKTSLNIKTHGVSFDEASTRGHALVVMLSYMIVRELKKAWRGFDLTVEEGLDELNRLCAMQLSIKDGGQCLRVPEPSPIAKELLECKWGR